MRLNCQINSSLIDFGDLLEALAAFEESMRERASPKIRSSLKTQDLLFAEDAPGLLAACFVARLEQPSLRPN